jgi:hypothetical protein
MGEPAGIQEELTQRFVAAIRKSFQPCPLIGPKWFQLVEGPPPQFQFTALGKLAKAVCKNPLRVAQTVARNLDLGGLPVAEVVPGESGITVNLKND